MNLQEILPLEIVVAIAENAGKNSWVIWLGIPAIRPLFCARAAMPAFIDRVSTAERIETRMFGQLQSVDDEPSKIKYTLPLGKLQQVEWHYQDELHREGDLPALIDVNYCFVAWCHHGFDHRENGPAVIDLFDSQITWKKHGEHFRDAGPTRYTKWGAEWLDADGNITHARCCADDSCHLCAWFNNHCGEQKFWNSEAEKIEFDAQTRWSR